MQIMDDNEVVECETKIPNHSSPKIVKADDLKEVQKNQEPLLPTIENSKNEDSTKEVQNEENKENDKDLNENKLDEVVEDQEENDREEAEAETLNESLQIIDESDGVEEVTEEEKKVEKEEEKVDIPDKPAASPTVIEDVGSDNDADKDKKPELNGNVEEEMEEDEEEEAVNLSSDTDMEKSSQEEKLPEITIKQTPAPPLSSQEKNENIQEQKKETKKSPETVKVKEESELLSSQATTASSATTNTTNTRKRPLETDETEEIDDNPSKRLRAELESSLGQHNKILREYIELTANSSNLKDLQQHIAMVDSEIYALDKMLRAKEEEWNNILHLKKVKEEIRLRLNRKKSILELNNTSIEEMMNNSDNSKHHHHANNAATSTPIASHNNSQQHHQQHQEMAFNNSSLLQSTLKNVMRESSGKKLSAKDNSHNLFAQNLNQNVTMIPLNSNNSNSTSSSGGNGGSSVAQAISNRINTKPSEKDESAAQKIHR